MMLRTKAKILRTLPLVCLWVAATFAPVVGWAQWGQVHITKGPYLQDVTPSSIVVMWETNVPADSTVSYTDPAGFGGTVPEKSSGRMHRVRLTGLTPGTRYEYRVASGGIASGPYSFKTAPAGDQAITFVAYGDNRSGIEKHQRIAAQIRRVEPDFILHTGDMVMDGQKYEEWGTEFFGPLKDVICRAPIYPVMGNHEALSKYFYEFFSFPGGGTAQKTGYYSFDYGPAHFAGVNVYEDYRPGSAQHKWLREDLLKAKDAQWRFVFLHFPPFTSGERCFDIETVETRAFLQKLFEEAKVDMVFGGHDHIYERTFPIKGAHRDDAGGIVYVVAAGGGAALYDVDPQWWSAYAEPRNNFVVVRIHGQSLALEACDRDGMPFDQFRISKDGREIEQLKAQVASTDDEVRIQAALQLGQYVDERVVEPLLLLLDDSKVAVRRAASAALAATAQPKAVETILKRLDQADVETRQNLSEALTRSRAPIALRGLAVLADATDDLTRLMALGGIRWIANRAVADPWLRQIRHINPTLRRYAMAALRKIGQLVEDTTPEGRLKDAKRKERLDAIAILQRNPDRNGVGPLLDLLRMDWQDIVVKKEIFRALAIIDPKKHGLLKEIIVTDAMKSRDPAVRKEVVGLLSGLRDRAAYPLLMAALEDEQVEVRSAAYSALQLMTGKDYRRDKAKWQAWYEKWRTSSQPSPAKK